VRLRGNLESDRSPMRALSVIQWSRDLRERSVAGGALQQQGFNTMRVHHIFARRPGEGRESAVL